jgi:hypothetical protein
LRPSYIVFDPSHDMDRHKDSANSENGPMRHEKHAERALTEIELARPFPRATYGDMAALA